VGDPPRHHRLGRGHGRHVFAGMLFLLALGVKSPVPATWTQVGLLAATLVVMVLLRGQVRATNGRARTGRSRPTRTPWI